MSYQSYFQEALAAYNLLDDFDVDGKIAQLDAKLYTYSRDQSPGNLAAVKTAFQPIADYYSRLTEVNSNIQKYLDKASKYVADSQTRLVNEERYDDRIHPAESTKSREIMFGLLPTLRATTLPYILTAGVFMSLITLFLIFQMLGITGQMNLPPALVQWWITWSAGPPFYKDPLVLAGAAVVFIASTIIFGLLYYKAKSELNTTKR
jgi:hypothetical protein